MIETGLFYVVNAINSAEKQQRIATIENGNESVDIFLSEEGVLRFAISTELMECNGIVDSNHRIYFIDADMEDYFSEELVERDVRKKRILNPRRKAGRELFAKTGKEMTNATCTESQLQMFTESKIRSRIGQADKDIAHVLQRSRKKVEGELIGIDKG